MPDQIISSPDGTLHSFPEGMSQDAIHMAMLSRYGNGQVAKPPVPEGLQPSPYDKPTISAGMSGGLDPTQLKRTLSGILPVLGSFAGPLGTGAGIAADQALSPDDPSIKRAATDAAFQEGLPRLLSGAGSLGGGLAKRIVDAKNNPAIKEWIAQQVEKIAPNTNSELIQQGADNARAVDASAPPSFVGGGRTGPKKANLQQVTPLSDNPIGQDLLKVPSSGPVPEGVDFGKMATKITNDPSSVYNAKLAMGPENVDKLLTNRAIGKAFNPAKNTFDPDALLNEIGGSAKESYMEGMSDTTLKNLQDFTNKVKQLGGQSDKQTGIINFVKNRLIYHVAGTAGGAALGGPIGALAGEGTVILGSKALAALSENEMLGKMAIKALETSPSDEMAPIVQRTLMYGLRGVPLIYRGKDGTEESVTVNDKGQLQGAH